MRQFLNENDFWRQVARFQRNEENMIRMYKQRIREIIEATNDVRRTNRDARTGDLNAVQTQLIAEEKQRFHTAMNRITRAMLRTSYDTYLRIKRGEAPIVMRNPDGSGSLAYRKQY